MGVEFDVVVPDIAEVEVGEPGEAVLESARRKAMAVEAGAGTVVIGCDTEVVVDRRLLGKPVDEGRARESLELLSGRSHDVVSGLVLVGPDPGQERSGVATSTVTFRELGAAELDRYLASGEWRERAGSYAIQGLGATLVDRVVGDISNVIGLPLGLLLQLEPELGATSS